MIGRGLRLHVGEEPDSVTESGNALPSGKVDDVYFPSAKSQEAAKLLV